MSRSFGFNLRVPTSMLEVFVHVLASSLRFRFENGLSSHRDLWTLILSIMRYDLLRRNDSPAMYRSDRFWGVTHSWDFT